MEWARGFGESAVGDVPLDPGASFGLDVLYSVAVFCRQAIVLAAGLCVSASWAATGCTTGQAEPGSQGEGSSSSNSNSNSDAVATTIGDGASSTSAGASSSAAGPEAEGASTEPSAESTGRGESTSSEDDTTSESSGADDGWTVLFDGRLGEAWRMSTIANQPGQEDPGGFEVVDGALESRPGTDLGLLWHTVPTPADFELSLEWRQSTPGDNSGVFLRFPDLDAAGYNNTAWVAIDFGFEIQIDATGAPDGAPVHSTGAIYGQSDQELFDVRPRAVGEWNTYVIRAEGQRYEVMLNGRLVTRFENQDRSRGVASAPGMPSFVGLQSHTGSVQFRDIRIRSLR